MSGDLAQMLVQHLRVSGALAEFADMLTAARREDDARAEWEVTSTNITDRANLAPGWEPFAVVPETPAFPAAVMWRRRVN